MISNNVLFLEMFSDYYLRIYWQKQFFSKWSQKTLFSKICWYFRIYVQKINFSEWSQNNVNSLEMLIFLDIRRKKFFLKKISKERDGILTFSEIWLRTILWWSQKKTTFSRNVVLYGIFRGTFQNFAVLWHESTNVEKHWSSTNISVV